MSTQTLPLPTEKHGDIDDDITHIVCCDDEFCLCGIRIDDNAWGDTGKDCPICYYTPCKVCGWAEGVL